MDELTVLIMILWARYRRRARKLRERLVCDGPANHDRLVETAPASMRKYLEA